MRIRLNSASMGIQFNSLQFSCKDGFMWIGCALDLQYTGSYVILHFTPVCTIQNAQLVHCMWLLTFYKVEKIFDKLPR